MSEFVEVTSYFSGMEFWFFLFQSTMQVTTSYCIHQIYFAFVRSTRFSFIVPLNSTTLRHLMFSVKLWSPIFNWMPWTWFFENQSLVYFQLKLWIHRTETLHLFYLRDTFFPGYFQFSVGYVMNETFINFPNICQNKRLLPSSEYDFHCFFCTS